MQRSLLNRRQALRLLGAGSGAVALTGLTGCGSLSTDALSDSLSAAFVEARKKPTPQDLIRQLEQTAQRVNLNRIRATADRAKANARLLHQKKKQRDSHASNKPVATPFVGISQVLTPEDVQLYTQIANDLSIVAEEIRASGFSEPLSGITVSDAANVDFDEQTLDLDSLLIDLDASQEDILAIEQESAQIVEQDIISGLSTQLIDGWMDGLATNIIQATNELATAPSALFFNSTDERVVVVPENPLIVLAIWAIRAISIAAAVAGGTQQIVEGVRNNNFGQVVGGVAIITGGFSGWYRPLTRALYRFTIK